MIYFITKGDIDLSPYNDIESCTINFMIRYLTLLEEIGVDSETTGFQPHVCKILLLQLGDFDNQFVIDCTTIDISKIPELKYLLETKIIILHNAKFDIRFLFKENIRPHKNVFDTFLAERVLTTGLDFHKKSLKECAWRYLRVTLDKSTRGKIHKLGVCDPSVIRYSALDVK